jgi:hypothetical protein
MQSPSAVVALPLIAVKAVPTFNVDLLLEVEVVLQPLILELLVEILELASSAQIVHDLLL